MATHDFQANDPLSKVPPGINVEVGSNGTLAVRHDVKGIEEMARRFKEAQTNDEER
jgi:hypothetical protein